ncbi:MAG TPA: hypothetical protein VFE38_16565 [Edaphobacter sp.]|nr:hypothetical protein [Edaphobacter sp.]
MLGLAAAFGLAGCAGGANNSGSISSPGSGSSGNTPATPTAGVAMSGTVHGGQKPLAGATIYLYAAGNSGYGTGATSLLSGTVTTDPNGKFSIPDSFTCPSADSLVYLIAKGGDAGNGDNAKSTLMSALGRCGDLSAGMVIDVSEVSSVASVYALAQFMSPGSTDVGTSSTNVTGLVNAFSTVNNLVDTNGAARSKTPAGNGTVPQSTINTLANIIAACVDSKDGSQCQQLFSLTTPAGGSAPTDTLSALLEIALNPGINVASLYTLATAQPAYQPNLANAPSDWTLSIEYTGGGLNRPQLLAVDGQGNIWAPNAIDPGSLSEFSPVGAPLSPTAGFTGGGLSYPEAVAIDATGNIWSANEGTGSVSKHASNGSALSGTSGYGSSRSNRLVALALDASGNVWGANLYNTVLKFTPAGTLTGQLAGGGLDVPYAVAIDASQNIWIANSGNSNGVSKFTSSGAPASITGYSGGGMSGPVGIAIDATGSAWVANFNRASVTKLSSNGTPSSGAGYATPAEVSAVAVDGANTVWTANTDGSISRFTSSGAAISPATGYISAGATGEVGIALDASGNVWTTDNYVDSIFEFIGAASPVVTPMQTAVKNNKLGQRP